MTAKKRSFLSMFTRDPAKPAEWHFKASPSCLARIDSVPLIHELQKDYCQSDVAKSGITSEQLELDDETRVLNKQAKTKTISDIARCGHLITDDTYYLISREEPDDETVRQLWEQQAPKPVNVIVLSDSAAENIFYADLKSKFDTKYGTEAANYLMANMHQDGFLNIGRSYMLAQAKMHGHQLLKASDTSIQIGLNDEGQLMITERFVVQDIQDYVNDDMESIEPREGRGPLAIVEMQSKVVKGPDGHLQVQAADFKLDGYSSAATREAFKALVPPHADLLPTPEGPSADKENIAPNRQKNR